MNNSRSAREQRKKDAVARNKERTKRSPQQQLEVLDKRYAVAAKERVILKAKIKEKK